MKNPYICDASFLENSRTYGAMFEEMDAELERFKKHWHDDCRFLSGWGHTYFCPEDGGKIMYNLETPDIHICSVCGKKYKGALYDNAYITFLRNEAITSLVKAALLYKARREDKYMDFIKKTIDFYAERYDRFAVHSRDVISENPTLNVGGAGKIMPQGLNEAIIMIRIINALEIVKDVLDDAWLIKIKSQFFDKAVALLLPQKMHIHNIPCWINSAIGVMGFFCNEKSWIDEAGCNPFNINEQIEKGVTDSGFWYEGSIHYNSFALEGILNYFIFAAVYNYPTSENSKRTLLKMLDAAYKYAFDNDMFPNPGDSWPNVGLKTYSYLYYMAYKIFGDVVYPYIFHIEKNTLPRIGIPLTEPYYWRNKIPLEKIMFFLMDGSLQEVIPPKRSSYSFEKYNCALLRNDNVNLFLKYGHQTKSHAHPDKMNVEIMVKGDVFTKDLANSGYASRLCDIWHRAQAAHNTCIVNFETSDIENAGKLLRFTDNCVEAECVPYKDTVFRRSLEITKNDIRDVFFVQCPRESVIDYFLHFECAVNYADLSLTETNDISEYSAITKVYKVENFTGKIGSKLGVMCLEMEDGMKAYFAKTFNNPANTMRDTFILRKHSDKACFKYRFLIT